MAITGEVPLAEITDYQSRLKSMTGGQGATASSSRATPRCRRNVQQKLASKFQLHEDDE
jgi:elongation factor G